MVSWKGKGRDETESWTVPCAFLSFPLRFFGPRRRCWGSNPTLCYYLRLRTTYRVCGVAGLEWEGVTASGVGQAGGRAPTTGWEGKLGDVVLSFHIMLLTLNAARRNPRLTGIGFRHAARARKRRNARYELNYLLALPRVELVSQSSPRVITIHNAPSSVWIRLGTPTALRLVIGES